MRRWGYSGVIVAVSGDDNREDFLAAGADAFLLKPLDPSSLQAVIDRHFAVAVTADGAGAGTPTTYSRRGSQSAFRAPTSQVGSAKTSHSRPQPQVQPQAQTQPQAQPQRQSTATTPGGGGGGSSSGLSLVCHTDQGGEGSAVPGRRRAGVDEKECFLPSNKNNETPRCL
jgi:hypothetical protein